MRQHPFEELPFPHHRAEAQQLVDRLVRIYYREDRIVPVLERAGLSPADIAFGPTGRITWMNVLTEARAQERIEQLLGAVLADPAAAAIHADIRVLMAPVPEIDPGGSRDERGRPARAGEWRAPQPPGLEAIGPDPLELAAPRRLIDVAWVKHLQRATGSKSTLLDYDFLEKGQLAGRSVARVRASFDGVRRTGTGFLIAPDLLLTNHHVLHDTDATPGLPPSPATEVEVWFGFEHAASGELRPVDVIPCVPASIQGSAALDWAVVRLSRVPDPTKFPVLPLPRALSVKKDDSVCIIQHPRGEPKQIGILRNLVVDITDDLVQYLTDTDEGSSGSPVFNTRWQVVALHHASWSPESDPLEVRNQGIRIDRVAAELVQRGLIT